MAALGPKAGTQHADEGTAFSPIVSAVPSDAEKRRRGEVGARIIHAYRLAGLQQAELAQRIGVSPRWVRKLERGEAQPDAYLERIARETGVDLTWLRTGEKPSRDEEIAELRREIQDLTLRFQQLRDLIARQGLRENGDSGVHQD